MSEDLEICPSCEMFLGTNKNCDVCINYLESNPEKLRRMLDNVFSLDEEIETKCPYCGNFFEKKLTFCPNCHPKPH